MRWVEAALRDRWRSHWYQVRRQEWLPIGTGSFQECQRMFYTQYYGAVQDLMSHFGLPLVRTGRAPLFQYTYDERVSAAVLRWITG